MPMFTITYMIEATEYDIHAENTTEARENAWLRAQSLEVTEVDEAEVLYLNVQKSSN